ncbi:MAG: hypothetical protein C0432_02960 [Candidatus Puniceispirillum sp.]|nr:hypothetical protein [Candidatus Pelagibacter sp.]MBA4283236.1 hypothetical protein [Candidatus Puniceispirillum sp.]
MILHINKKKESKKIRAAFKSLLIMATYVSTVYVLDYQDAFSTERNTRYLSSKGYRIKKKKPTSLSEQGFYDGTYQKLFPHNFIPYSKQQPQNILSQSSITDKDLFIQDLKTKPIAENQQIYRSAETIEKSETKITEKEGETTDVLENSTEQTSKKTITSEEKTSDALLEKNISEKNDTKELMEKKNQTESTPTMSNENEKQKIDVIKNEKRSKKNRRKSNKNSEHIKNLEQRLANLEKKLLEKNPNDSSINTEKETETTLRSDNITTTNNKSEEFQSKNQIEQTGTIGKNSDEDEQHQNQKGQILSFIYVQGTEAPHTIEYTHKGSKHSFSMNTEQAKKILSNITYVEQEQPKHPKDSSGTFTHNPLLTTYQDIQKISHNSSTQETLCIFRNGPYFITFDFKNPQKKNPSLNAGEIYVYNQLFDKSFSKKSYYIQSIKKGSNAKVYLGKIIDTGTTVIPGDTICVTQDILYSNSDDFIKNSTIGKTEVLSNTPGPKNDVKPSEIQAPILIPASTPTAISTSAQKQIIAQPQKSDSPEAFKPLKQSNTAIQTNSPTITNAPKIKEQQISLPQTNNTPSLKIETSTQNNTTPMPRIINSETSKSSKYDIRI